MEDLLWLVKKFAGDCGSSDADINTVAVENWFVEYWQMTLQQFISVGVGEDLGSNFKINFQKNFRAAWKKVPTTKLEHQSCTFSPDCWYNLRTDQGHLGNAQQKM